MCHGDDAQAVPTLYSTFYNSPHLHLGARIFGKRNSILCPAETADAMCDQSAAAAVQCIVQPFPSRPNVSVGAKLMEPF